jgi:hypothetical protein
MLSGESLVMILAVYIFIFTLATADRRDDVDVGVTLWTCVQRYPI